MFTKFELQTFICDPNLDKVSFSLEVFFFYSLGAFSSLCSAGRFFWPEVWYAFLLLDFCGYFGPLLFKFFLFGCLFLFALPTQHFHYDICLFSQMLKQYLHFFYLGCITDFCLFPCTFYSGGRTFVLFSHCLILDDLACSCCLSFSVTFGMSFMFLMLCSLKRLFLLLLCCFLYFREC